MAVNILSTGGGGKMSATLAVNLDAADDEVTVYGSDDGGTTRRVMKTDSGGAVQVDIEAALPAGENFIGLVGSTADIITSNIVMSVAGAYATGDYIGTSTTPQSFASAVRSSGKTGTIKSIRITDKLTTTAVNLELWLFSATFVAPTDNAAWTITDAEALTCLGVIPIDSSKWYASGANKIYTDDTISLLIKPAVTSLFYALVARGATPTWASLDLDIGLGIFYNN